MRLAVTGRLGQVASSLAERAPIWGVSVAAIGRPDFDLSAPGSVLPALAATGPDVVVSAAAYTAVDRAEDEPDLAFAVNAAGAGHVADAAARLGCPVIHLSTDYVYDGRKGRPYAETDPTAPLNVYGASKLAGEAAVARANPRYLILRTAWVYSPFGRNFLRTMLRLAAERDEIAVVADQWGNPTCAFDIADAVLRAAALLTADSSFSAYGVYHLAGTGETNWSGFARHILDTSRRHGGPHAAVRDIATADYPTRAARPADTRLSSDSFQATFGWRIPDWTGSAESVVRRALLSR